MFGDWIYWNDQVNGAIPPRLPAGVSPPARLSNLSPEQSSLNKPLYGVVGTPEIRHPRLRPDHQLQQRGTRLPARQRHRRPSPTRSRAAIFWGVRGGHNSSSNAATNGDNYTRMTNYIASTLAAGMGQFVGPGHQRHPVPARPARPSSASCRTCSARASSAAPTAACPSASSATSPTTRPPAPGLATSNPTRRSSTRRSTRSSS